MTIPGKIVKIVGDVATLDYGSELREAKIVEGDYRVGDFVLVQAKVIIEKVSGKQMEGWLEVLQEINEREAV